MNPQDLLSGIGQDDLITLIERVAGSDAAQEMARQLGLTGRYLASGVAGMGSAFANPIAYAGNKALEASGSDYRFPEQYGAVQDLLSGVGLPEPQGAIERGVGFVSEIGVPDPSDSARVVSGLSHLIDPQWAMTVFHGSPHKWDKVDLSKVGTGEGAQAYGHGFYTAERRGVAEDYARKLTPDQIKKIESQLDIIGLGGHGYTKHLAEELVNNGGDLSAASNTLRRHAKSFLTDGDQRAYDSLSAYADRLDSAGPRTFTIQQGHLYELDLPDSTIDKMLDWDKPLSEQPEAVKTALQSAGMFVEKDGKWYHRVPHPDREVKTGQDVYHLLEGKKEPFDKAGWTKQAKQASDILNSIGIPGIKYLDGTSRNAGEGTRNFVVFDESYITPLKRNGEALK